MRFVSQPTDQTVRPSYRHVFGPPSTHPVFPCLRGGPRYGVSRLEDIIVPILSKEALRESIAPDEGVSLVKKGGHGMAYVVGGQMYPATDYLVRAELVGPGSCEDLRDTGSTLVDEIAHRRQVQVEDFGLPLALLLQKHLGQDEVKRLARNSLRVISRLEYLFQRARGRGRASREKIVVLEFLDPLVARTFGVIPGRLSGSVLVVNARAPFDEQLDDLRKRSPKFHVVFDIVPTLGNCFLDSCIERRPAFVISGLDGGSPGEQQSLNGPPVSRIDSEMQGRAASVVLQIWWKLVLEEIPEQSVQLSVFGCAAFDKKRALDGVDDGAVVNVAGQVESA